MKQLGSLLVLAVGSGLVAFACSVDSNNGDDDNSGESGQGGEQAGTAGRGGSGGTLAGSAGNGGKGGNGGRAGEGGVGGSAAGLGGSPEGGAGMSGAGGATPVECLDGSNDYQDVLHKACAEPGNTCEFGRECCCGQCFPSYSCDCDGGVWSCLSTDTCLFLSCGGAGGQGGEGGMSGAGASSGGTGGDVSLGGHGGI